MLFSLQVTLNTCDKLSTICENGDIQIVEVSVVWLLSGTGPGYGIKMPDFLDKNSEQSMFEKTNEMRLVRQHR